MSKSNRKREMERKKKTRNIRIAIAAAAAVCLITAGFFVVRKITTQSKPNEQISALKEHVFESYNSLSEQVAEAMPPGGFVVFLSLCNKEERAFVVKGSGDTLRAAWANAEQEADRRIGELSLNVIWAKADIVFDAEKAQKSELYSDISSTRYDNFFRRGVAFDDGFKVAFMEAELSANRIIDYNADPDEGGEYIRLDRANRYLENHLGQDVLDVLPDSFITFSTIGFFCDEGGKVLDLYTGGLDYGRRVTGVVDGAAARDVILKASEYLHGMLKPDGEYVYGYFPISGNEIDNYNILRHTGSTWALINLYRMSGDDSVVSSIDAAINYLVEGSIEHTSTNAAYVIEQKAGEVKLGGNGLAVIMLTEYMDVFGTKEYVELVRALADGILNLQEEDGAYYHVLEYPGYAPKEQFRTVYYDGEATFALTRAYTYTGDQRYLEGAARAVEYFIANDYEKYRDHWVSYSMNEITKYIDDPRYYEFAMRNVGSNLDYMYGRATLHPTYLELLMAGWQTHERMIEKGVQADYELDMQFFAETIYQRVFHMLNGIFYPELAMYMVSPAAITDAFFVRDDSFRIRIDDIQHYIGGNYFYINYYEDVRQYLTGEFLSEIHGANIYAAVQVYA